MRSVTSVLLSHLKVGASANIAGKPELGRYSGFSNTTHELRSVGRPSGGQPLLQQDRVCRCVPCEQVCTRFPCVFIPWPDLLCIAFAFVAAVLPHWSPLVEARRV